MANRRLGRDRPQDGSSYSDHAEPDYDPDAVEPGGLNPENHRANLGHSGALSSPTLLAQPYLETET